MLIAFCDPLTKDVDGTITEAHVPVIRVLRRISFGNPEHPVFEVKLVGCSATHILDRRPASIETHVIGGYF